MNMPMDVDHTMADEDELASSTSFSANDNGASIKDQVKDTAQQALTQTQQAAGQALDKAKDTVKSQLGAQKDKAVGTLGSFTDALHQTGQQLRQSGQGVFGDYADNLAGQIDRAVSYLRENDVDDLTAQIEDAARKQPALFMGGAFVLGVALARFLKSSAPAPAMPEQPQQQLAISASNTAIDNHPSWNSDSATTAEWMPSSSDSAAMNSTPDVAPWGNASTSSSFDTLSAPFELEDTIDDNVIPDNQPLSAHGYVTGFGVVHEDALESGDTEGDR